MPACLTRITTCLMLIATGCERDVAPPNTPLPSPQSVVKMESPDPHEWQPLLAADSLAGWKVPIEWDFKQHGPISVVNGEVTLGEGKPATGIAWVGGSEAPVRGELPRINYELELEAKRTAGSDFFCGLTFPVGNDYLTLIVGGWGGGVLGLSNIDNLNASENETSRFLSFDENRWYKLRLQVTAERVTVWLDGEQTIDLPLADKKLSIWFEQEPMKPLGIGTWNTAAVLRNVKIRKLRGE